MQLKHFVDFFVFRNLLIKCGNYVVDIKCLITVLPASPVHDDLITHM